ncbi:MAG TPA: divergent polysaccharide deacetylase family protein, partial [Thermoanaerobaculia bacterium]|nr:divergent polysaccharide deacetylase family protein [Thermoanaerobaculia bacterium]
GRSLDEVRDLAALGVPLTYAVLPFETRTPEVVAALAGRRAEVLLHLPMEGRGGADPGPGALSAAMSRRELAAGTRAALAAVPGASGVNNHMGSVLTADPAAMRAVLAELAGRGLYFLDSRTSARSVAFATARDLGLPAAERHVFLDPDPRPEAVRGQFRRLLALARENGAAIAIGHPYPSTRAVLAEEVPAAVELGYRFVPVGELVGGGG